MPTLGRRDVRWILGGTVGTVLVVALLAFEVRHTRETRAVVGTYSALIDAANRQDVQAARALCTARYLATQDVQLSPEGGLTGLPRNIHKNFQAWREGSEVWLCPTNRQGVIFRFRQDGDVWKFDGPVGFLRAGGRVERVIGD